MSRSKNYHHKRKISVEPREESTEDFLVKHLQTSYRVKEIAERVIPKMHLRGLLL